ncbi:GNAT family N-acetyltransferase [Actinoplanes sp. NPDC048967]|uniref:GNAT family N-acetyltransferase n=1 Tax=Actinoplanes sp. NPDC048967 TaxID=3155269 RepID=UPI003408AA2E
MSVIAPLPPAAADDPELIGAVTRLVNRVYQESEQGLWVDGAARTDAVEVAAMVRAGELLAAYRDDRLAGVLRLRRWDEVSSEFGMLAADPAVRGTGVGRQLVSYAEATARSRGSLVMRLELLVPRTFTLASKEFLAAWYTRLGYRLERVGRIEELYPDLAPLLATPADFRVYRKPLDRP